ncbi:MAG TPA: type II CAAX endopeptidase family protein [Chitinophagaceae bacterium]|nr:type II CAAX endopeptidase family protein [Chitinophagaceae bacterium]
MRGSLKSKSALNQFLILLGVALISFFVIGLIGTIILSAITGIGLQEMTDMSKLDFSQPHMVNFLRGLQVVQFISLFLIPVFICSRLFSTNSREYLGFKRPSHAGYIIAGVGLLLIAIPFAGWLGELNKQMSLPSNIENWMKLKEEEAARPVRALLSRNTIQDLVLNVFCIAALAGIGEELLFRGMVQRLLIKMFRSPWAGIIVAALIFSAMHMQFYGFLPRFMLGVLLGAIYWYSGSLWVAMLAHFIYDAVLVLAASFNPEMLGDENAVQFSNMAIIGSISLLLIILLVLWMKKKSTATYGTVYADDAIPVKNHPFDFER